MQFCLAREWFMKYNGTAAKRGVNKNNTKQQISNNLLSISLMRILDFSFDGGTENVTKWHYTWSPGLILGVFCTIFRAGPV